MARMYDKAAIAAAGGMKAYLAIQADKKRARSRVYRAERYRYLKERHICTSCGQQDAEPGKIYCWACRLYHNQRRSGAQQAPRR